jgi:hypothetical protein
MLVSVLYVRAAAPPPQPQPGSASAAGPSTALVPPQGDNIDPSRLALLMMMDGAFASADADMDARAAAGMTTAQIVESALRDEQPAAPQMQPQITQSVRAQLLQQMAAQQQQQSPRALATPAQPPTQRGAEQPLRVHGFYTPVT